MKKFSVNTELFRAENGVEIGIEGGIKDGKKDEIEGRLEENVKKKANTHLYLLSESLKERGCRLSIGRCNYHIAEPAANNSTYKQNSTNPPKKSKKRKLTKKIPTEEELLDQLDGRLLQLYDELSHAVAGNCFYFDAVDALTAELLTDIDPRSHLGLTLISQWLREKDKAAIDRLTELRRWLQDSINDRKA